MKRHLGTILLGAVLIVGGGLVAARALQATGGDAPADSERAPIRVPVEVAPITTDTLRDVRVLSGTLEASTRFEVAAKVEGLIERFVVDLGDVIERNQVVAEIDDAEFVQAVAQAEAELAVRKAEKAQATAELGRVQREYDRLQSLAERGVASDVEFDEIAASLAFQQAALSLAEARVRQAEASLELARIRLGYTTVRAIWEDGPDSVTVAQRYEDAGDTVQSSAPLIATVGLDPLTAVISITERDYPRLRVGLAATVATDAIPGRAFDAEISRIAPIFRETSRQARVELTVHNSRRQLKPGMFARVRLVLREAQSPVVVPLAALTKRGGQRVVFVLSDDRESVSMVPVTVNIVDGERAGIVGANLTGEVVTLGQQMLTDGSPVVVRPPATQPAAEASGS